MKHLAGFKNGEQVGHMIIKGPGADETTQYFMDRGMIETKPETCKFCEKPKMETTGNK